MTYLVEGAPEALDNMIREQRVRVDRGELTFTALDAGTCPALPDKEEDGEKTDDSDFGSFDDKYTAKTKNK